MQKGIGVVNVADAHSAFSELQAIWLTVPGDPACVGGCRQTGSLGTEQQRVIDDPRTTSTDHQRGFTHDRGSLDDDAAIAAVRDVAAEERCSLAECRSRYEEEEEQNERC